MSPPKGGYGGVEIPSDPPSGDAGEQLLRDAARALRAAERRFDEEARSLRQATSALEHKFAAELAGVNAKLAKQGEDLATILLVTSTAKSAWNQFGKHVIAYGLALFAGGWGVSKATEKNHEQPPVVIQKPSAIDDLLKECRKLPDSPPNSFGITPQMECWIRISREQFTPRQ